MMWWFFSQKAYHSWLFEMVPVGSKNNLIVFEMRTHFCQFPGSCPIDDMVVLRLSHTIYGRLRWCLWEIKPLVGVWDGKQLFQCPSWCPIDDVVVFSKSHTICVRLKWYLLEIKTIWLVFGMGKHFCQYPGSCPIDGVLVFDQHPYDLWAFELVHVRSKNYLVGVWDGNKLFLVSRFVSDWWCGGSYLKALQFVDVWGGTCGK